MKPIVYASLVCLFAKTLTFSQVVSINSPEPWTTLRDMSVEAGILLDTANIEQKSMRIKLTKTQNGRKATLSNKLYNINEFPENVALGSVKQRTLGGDNFYAIEWNIPGSDHEGSVAPLGVAVLDTPVIDPFLTVKKVQAVTDVSALGKMVGDSLVEVGPYEMAAGYTDSVLYLYLKKDSGQSSTISFAVDGKNAKNAFISYPDRFISYSDSTDSISAYHFTRSFRNDSISYQKSVWYASISKNTGKNAVMISIPWHDLGFLPFDGRVFGFAVTASKGGEETKIPVNADDKIPATWGDAILEQKQK